MGVDDCPEPSCGRLCREGSSCIDCLSAAIGWTSRISLRGQGTHEPVREPGTEGTRDGPPKLTTVPVFIYIA